MVVDDDDLQPPIGPPAYVHESPDRTLEGGVLVEAGYYCVKGRQAFDPALFDQPSLASPSAIDLRMSVSDITFCMR